MTNFFYSRNFKLYKLFMIFNFLVSEESNKTTNNLIAFQLTFHFFLYIKLNYFNVAIKCIISRFLKMCLRCVISKT